MADPTALAPLLYEACAANFTSDHLFYQQDLISLDVIPNNDVSLLMATAQALVNQNLFRMLQDKDDRLAWKLISREDAEKFKNFNAEEKLVYNVIHSSGRAGAWIRTIKTRTGLHQTIVNRCLKALEGKNYIKGLYNVKFPRRRMFMLAGLQPTEDVTGGAWFTDGVLDADFIRTLGAFVEEFVACRSWHDTESKPKAKKQKTLSGKAAGTRFLPYPASYKSYPTTSDVTHAVNAAGVTAIRVGEQQIAQLLEMMVYDGKLISINDGIMYRAVKKPNQIDMKKELGISVVEGEGGDRIEKAPGLGSSGMTEAPCSRCPVFNLCEEGGPVNPENCEYFDEWLKKAVEF